MWALDDDLEEWFDDVRVSIRHPRPADDDDEVPMMQNSLARGRGR
jgi:hypothetical protein